MCVCVSVGGSAFLSDKLCHSFAMRNAGKMEILRHSCCKKHLLTKVFFSLAQTLFKHHFQEHQPRAKVRIVFNHPNMKLGFDIVTLHLHAHFNRFVLGCCVSRTLSAGHSSTAVSLCWKNTDD